ncbi:complex III assembly factor LYRM7 isoform X2 [Andrena cerasifolii]|uniref:complex III assembly factor LYRM7 isoform X2 n=1 Tax=Andrena cerasifolii TaxID=2819439 RepID=UPI004037D4D3
MGDSLKRQVLQVFKKLHRTRLNTFKDDEHALEVTRNKINEEYRKHQNVTDATAIEELNKFAQEVEHEIRTTVIQAVEKEPGTFALRITPDTTLLDNVPYKDIDEQCPTNSSDVKTTSSEDCCTEKYRCVTPGARKRIATNDECVPYVAHGRNG